MAHRVLALTLVSGHNLKDVNVFSRMEVYGVASVYGDPRTRQRTKTDRDGCRHPTWDPEDAFRFVVPPTAAAASASGGAYLHVLLRTERLFSFCDGDVGEVFIPLADLLAGACPAGGATGWQCASFQVRKVQCSERRGRGTLKVSYCFGPVMTPVFRDEPAAVAGHHLTAPPWQRHPPPYAYAPMYQVVYPRMLPGVGGIAV
jgi:hypothetical protein